MGVTIDRRNNFDFLRLVLASLVIVAHSYPLTKNKEILMAWTNNQEDFGSFAVNGFFALSGYFIFLSLQRSKTIANYFWKRILRLYPALFGLMIFTLALVPILYEGNHLTSTIKNYWVYALNGLTLYRVKYFITGIFENNPFQSAINGSLWTLCYEFSMYMLLIGLFFIRKKKISYVLLFSGFFISYYFMHYDPSFLQQSFLKINLQTEQLYRLATYFLAGSCLTFFDLKRINTLYVRIGLFLVILLSFILNFYTLAAPIVLPLFLILVGSLNTKPINDLGDKFGDISYGVYIYGFLVQQIFMNYFNFNPLTLMVCSLIVTYILAYFSWHLIEKKMLGYKNVIK